MTCKDFIIKIISISISFSPSLVLLMGTLDWQVLRTSYMYPIFSSCLYNLRQVWAMFLNGMRRFSYVDLCSQSWQYVDSTKRERNCIQCYENIWIPWKRKLNLNRIMKIYVGVVYLLLTLLWIFCRNLFPICSLPKVKLFALSGILKLVKLGFTTLEAIKLLQLHNRFCYMSSKI